MLVRLNSMAVRHRLKGSDSPVEFERGSRPRLLSLETLIALGLGSDLDGAAVSSLICGNHMGRMSVTVHRRCTNNGTISCPRCHLVKYCSERCQKQHWPRHSSTCAHPYLDKSWQPTWIVENREPQFIVSPSWPHSLLNAHTPKKPHIFPGVDILQLFYNEKQVAETMDFKLCFTSCSDIRNLVRTVNSLPKDYKGRCEILVNDTDSTVMNRNLVILFALLSAGPSIEEAAELATHLMYSTVLTAQQYSYVQRCVDYIYSSDASSSSAAMSFRVRLATRGSGSSIYSTQPMTGVRQPREMFHGQSTHLTLSAALKSMHCTITQDDNSDSWDWFLSKLSPPHRMSFKNYRETGILSPFPLNTTNFSQPNRLLFSPQGEWLGDANPLRGWDISSVLISGDRHGVDPADILGCLFFHVKSQLREFARRVKDSRIDIHLTQFDPKILSTGLLSGALGPNFGGGCFDRVDTGCLMEEIGVKECLSEWGPLLNKNNPCSAILMSTRTWHNGSSMAKLNPRAALASIMKKCFKVPGLHSRFKKSFAQGLRSPKLLRMIESLDAFYDHDKAFYEFLKEEKVDIVSKPLGLELRRQHQVHSKRFGVPLRAPDHQLPCLGRNEFYQLATLCGVNFSVRFLEFGLTLGDSEH